MPNPVRPRKNAIPPPTETLEEFIRRKFEWPDVRKLVTTVGHSPERRQQNRMLRLRQEIEAKLEQEYSEQHREYFKQQQRLERAREYSRRPKVKQRVAAQTIANAHGITLRQRAYRLTKQGGGCAICSTTWPGKRGWQIDHDAGAVGHHIRGILCLYCNLGLGCFFDSPQKLALAAAYLEQRGFTTGAEPWPDMPRQPKVALNLTPEEKREIRAAHCACDICGEDWPRENEGPRGWHLDHDHRGSGELRGVLCRNCNAGLGFFRDSPDLLRAAAEYLAANNGRRRRKPDKPKGRPRGRPFGPGGKP